MLFLPPAPCPANRRCRHLLPLLLLPLLLLLAAPAVLAGGPRQLVLDGSGPQQPVALLRAGKTDYLVTAAGVFRREGRRLVRRYQSPAPIRCALATDTVLWLGTTQGLLRLSPRTWRARPTALPAPAGPGGAVSTLFRAADGAVWAGLPGYGAFRQAGGHGGWEAQLSIPTINAGLSRAADSSVWVATNIGLYRYQHAAWTRYNEEGVANHEIPDNMVERLLPDNAGNLWVVMSEGLSVFAAPGPTPETDAELPTVRFIGRPGNAVYGVVQVPGQGHVFATAMGLLLLPTPASAPKALASPAPTTDRIETPRKLVRLPLPAATAAPTLLVPDSRRRVWAVGPAAATVWSARAFRRAVRAAAAEAIPAAAAATPDLTQQRR